MCARAYKKIVMHQDATAHVPLMYLCIWSCWNLTCALYLGLPMYIICIYLMCCCVRLKHGEIHSTYTHMTRYKTFASVHTGESPRQSPSLHYILPVQNLHYMHKHININVSKQWTCESTAVRVAAHISWAVSHITRCTCTHSSLSCMLFAGYGPWHPPSCWVSGDVRCVERGIPITLYTVIYCTYSTGHRDTPCVLCEQTTPTNTPRWQGTAKLSDTVWGAISLLDDVGEE